MQRFAIMAMAATLSLAGVAIAADAPESSHLDWPPHTLPGAAMTSTIFGLLGVILAVIGFKIFDWVTPGDLQKEVFEKHNVAASVLGAAVILGICLIIAAAVH